jgi:glycosyltransferase involved in cell wall biosynthesis
MSARSGSFDLIHADTLGMLPYTRPFAGIPIALNHHNIESHMLVRRSAREPNPAKRFYLRNEARKLRLFEKRYCPYVSINLVVSPLDVERLREIVGDAAVHVVDNGVDVEYFHPTPSPQNARRSLVFAGGMSWYANREAVHFLVRELWPKLVERDPKWELWIVGADPPPLVRAAAEDPRVDVPGFVDDVRPYLDRAQIYVCPIFDGGGTRLKILDALAMAKPLVATGLAVEGFGLEEERHYLRAETPAEFVTQIQRLDKEPELRARLAGLGRSFVESRFSWPVIGSKLEDAYASILSGTQAEPS